MSSIDDAFRRHLEYFRLEFGDVMAYELAAYFRTLFVANARRIHEIQKELEALNAV